jgi:hypothetical protein
MDGFGPFPSLSGGGDFYGNLYNIWRGSQADAAYDKFITEQIEPANIYGQQTAEALGPIGNTTQMAGNLYGRAKGLGAQYSDQETRDINQRYDQLGASGQAGLRARGIGGSTVAPSIAYANERNRGAELRSSNDARLNRMLGIEETFGGGEIAANQEAADARLRALGMRYQIAPGAPTLFQAASR